MEKSLAVDLYDTPMLKFGVCRRMKRYNDKSMFIIIYSNVYKVCS